MVRGISINGNAIPITDASISYSKLPIYHLSITDTHGNEDIYEGMLSNIHGSFVGAYRPDLINPIINNLLEEEPASYTICVMDDTQNTGITATTSYITMLEITLRSGELPKFNAQFIGKNIINSGSLNNAEFSLTIPPPYKTTINIDTQTDIKGGTIKIERPFNADIYTLDSLDPAYIHDLKKTKISGTISLARNAMHSSIKCDKPRRSNIHIQLEDEEGTTTNIESKITISQKEISINGRKPIEKIISWECLSNDLTIT